PEAGCRRPAWNHYQLATVMSYRAFKRLLGETSLERKCRFLVSGFTLVLITGSFLLYARQTDHLAYDQMISTCRLLVHPIVVRQHVPKEDKSSSSRPKELEDLFARTRAMDEFRVEWEQEHWTEAMRKYNYRFIKLDAPELENRPPDVYAAEKIKEFQADPTHNEDNQLLRDQQENHYYAAIRATKACLSCHYHQPARGELKEGDLL